MQASMNSIKHLWNHVLIHDTPCHPIHNWSLQAVQNINIPSPFYSPHTVSKYLCSFLWCAFSRVSTGTLSWLEGTLHALQRINIRTSMSRATRMLHAMATTAAVDSPVVEAESSRSHSCIADTETAFLPQTSCQDVRLYTHTYIYTYIIYCILYEECICKTDNSVFKNFQKSRFFIVHSN